MKQGNTRREIEKLIEDNLRAGKLVRAALVVESMITAHPRITGEDADWYQELAMASLLRLYKEAISSIKPEVVGQLVFAGAEFIQAGYTMKRDGEVTVVPLGQCTNEELLARADHYDSMAEGCKAHAAELRRYVDEREQLQA